MDGNEPFLTKYFSFIVLGLLLTLGYAVWRIFPPKKKTGEWQGAEKELMKAAAELRATPARQGDDDLALSPEKERGMALARRHAAEQGQGAPTADTHPEKDPE